MNAISDYAPDDPHLFLGDLDALVGLVVRH
jgi:hypothetical protein